MIKLLVVFCTLPFATHAMAQDAMLQTTSYGLALPKNNVTLRPKIESHVRKILVKEGQRVKKGEVLIELNWETAKARMKIAELAATERGEQMRAEAELAFAQSNFKRFKKLKKKNAVHQSEFEEAALRLETAEAQLQRTEETISANLARLELAQAELDEYYIKAPFDGEIVHMGINEGSVVTSSTDMIQIIGSDVLYVDLYLPINKAMQMDPGSLCQLKIREPFPGKVVDAELVFRSPIIEATTSGSVRVTFEISNHLSQLPAGFAVELSETVQYQTVAASTKLFRKDRPLDDPPIEGQ